MSKLKETLSEWTAQGFISQDQAKQICDFEAAKPENAWVMYGLLTLGAIVIGVGAISVIAANWYQIPANLKLVGDFVALSALAVWVYYLGGSSKIIQFEIALLFYMLFCLVSIGLISQVYHQEGEFYQALMLWASITFGVALAAQQLIVPFIWIGAFLIGLFFTFLNSTFMVSIFREDEYAVTMMMPLFCSVLMFASQKLNENTGITKAFQIWTLLIGLCAALFIEVLFLFKGSHQFIYFTAYLPGYFLSACVVFFIVQTKRYNYIQKILLLSLLGMFLLSSHLILFNVTAPSLYAICTVIFLGLTAMFLASMQERCGFQWVLLLVGIRFLILYFQALGGLAVTGIGLIVSGAILIAMTVLWGKYRTALAVWVEKRMQ